MKPRTPGEAIQQFVSTVNQQGLIGKQAEVVKLISGPISNARTKLQSVNSKEAETVLAQVGYPSAFGDDVRAHIVDIFQEEVLKAQRLLKELDSSVNVLSESLDDITYRLRTGSGLSSEGEGNRGYSLITDLYEDCRCILNFLKLKNKILKHWLLTPVDVRLSPDPFSQFPNYQEEEENILYLMCKIEHAHFSD